MILASATQSDDPEFIEIVNAVLRALPVQTGCRQLFVVQIDNWFDSKWLGFFGNGSVVNPMTTRLGLRGSLMDRFESAKAGFRGRALASRSAEDEAEHIGAEATRWTLPPFSPRRVIGQHSFLVKNGELVEAALPALHSSERRRSETNLRRFVADVSDDACFVWYSLRSAENKRASVMVYTVKDRSVQGWFAAFSKAGRWTVSDTANISRAEVIELAGQQSLEAERVTAPLDHA